MATNNTGKVNIKEAVNSVETANNWNLIIMMGAVIIITFFCLTPVLKNSFINQDDNLYIFENTNLGKPLPDAIGYFFEPHYFSGNYVPVTMIVYSIAYHVAGGEPSVYHGLSVFFHLCNVLLVFWLTFFLSKRKPYVAAVVALFFGIHPMHVESVAWAAELKDLLYTFFFIGGLIVYFKYIEWKSEQTNSDGISPLLFYVLILFAFSVLSKPAAVIFPVVLLLFDFYTGRRFDKWVWIEKMPFFIVSIVMGIVAIKAQQADDLINNHYPLVQKVLFAAYAIIAYMVKFLLPVNLSNFYPYPSNTGGHLPYLFYVAPVVVALLLYGVSRTLKYTRVVAFGFMFFFVNIALVLQILSVGNAIMADRYTYVPYIGLVFIIAMGADFIYNSISPKIRVYKQTAIVVLSGFAIVCSFLTYARCAVWENEDTVATDVLNKFPDDAFALNNKAYLLVTQGRSNEALPLFEQAVRVKPEYVKANINLINAYLSIKDYKRAMKRADTALLHSPKDYYLLNIKGYIFFTQHNYEAAVQLFNEAIALRPKMADGYISLAEYYYAQKEYSNQVRLMDVALKQIPDSHILLNIKGYALFLMGKYDEAVDCFKAALKIKPDFTTASVNLADCYKAMNGQSTLKQ